MKKLITTFAAVAALAAPGTALAAGSSTCQAYNPELCDVTGAQSTTSATSSAATLPFTGLDVAFLAVGGGGLLGAGLVVRRLSRQTD